MTRKFLAILITAACLGAFAQPASAQFGVSTLSLGPTLGLGSIGDAGLAIGGRVEKGVKQFGEELANGILGIQAGFTYWSYNNRFGGSDYGITYIPIGVTANYHFPIENNTQIDPFLGLGLGFEVISCDFPTVLGIDVCPNTGIYFIGRAGVRYFFSPALAGYADAGAGGATLNVGVMFQPGS